MTRFPAQGLRLLAHMFDTIILLTGPVEEAALSAVLRQYNPQLDVRPAKSFDELEAFDKNVLTRRD